MNPIGGCVRFMIIRWHAEAHLGTWGKRLKTGLIRNFITETCTFPSKIL